ncbi:MAG: hypothetical protein HQ477_13630 [Chloroflexi bacterium]|nr:hypothetical protein [Chloroflexota bacterium]
MTAQKRPYDVTWMRFVLAAHSFENLERYGRDMEQQIADQARQIGETWGRRLSEVQDEESYHVAEDFASEEYQTWKYEYSQ